MMEFEFEGYADEPVDIDLSAFDGADAIVALSGDRYVDYAARPSVRIRAADTALDDTRLDSETDDVVVAYSGCGEDEDYEGCDSGPGVRVVVVDFAPLLPNTMHGAAGVMAALDAVAAEVLR